MPGDVRKKREAGPELIQLVIDIQKTRNQDKLEALINRLILETQDRLYRFCLHLTNNQDTASELTQDVYLRAYSQLDKLGDPSGLFMWLFKIAKNLFIDETRRGETKVSKSSKHEDEENNLLGNLEGAPQNVETMIAVQEAFAKLTKDERAVILLIDREEYSYAEAAEIFGVSEKAMKSRISRAREAFLKIYKKGDPK